MENFTIPEEEFPSCVTNKFSLKLNVSEFCSVSVVSVRVSPEALIPSPTKFNCVMLLNAPIRLSSSKTEIEPGIIPP